MSLCTLPFECRYDKPLSTSLHTYAIMSSSSGLPSACMTSLTLPPAQYSMEIHRASGVR